jgi:hypothetical protein
VRQANLTGISRFLSLSLSPRLPLSLPDPLHARAPLVKGSTCKVQPGAPRFQMPYNAHKQGTDSTIWAGPTTSSLHCKPAVAMYTPGQSTNSLKARPPPFCLPPCEASLRGAHQRLSGAAHIQPRSSTSLANCDSRGRTTQCGQADPTTSSLDSAQAIAHVQRPSAHPHAPRLSYPPFLPLGFSVWPDRGRSIPNTMQGLQTRDATSSAAVSTSHTKCASTGTEETVQAERTTQAACTWHA